MQVSGGLASHFGGPEAALERLLDTDLWFRTFRVRSDFRGRYRLLVNAGIDDVESASLQELMDSVRAAQPDPLNPALDVWPVYPSDPNAVQERRSVLELPDAPPQPWFAVRSDVPKGAVEELTVTSHSGDERTVWVYTPPSSDSSAPPGVAVLLDGWVWAVAIPIAPTLDNLIAEGRIPPLAVVMVDSPDRWGDLAFGDSFLAFLADELLPLVRGRWGLTDDPGKTIIAGQSLGGLAAAYAGLELPHVFGNILSQAGAFYWKSETYWKDDDDLGEERITKAFAESPKLPLRFYVDVGLREYRKMLRANRRFRDVLEAKGYELTYREYNGGHEYLCWQGTMADG